MAKNISPMSSISFVQIMVLGTNLQKPMLLNKMVFVKGIITP
jgi:uncharacterized membrane protein YcaP (DUF421 family)